jgi:hypothetical protein
MPVDGRVDVTRDGAAVNVEKREGGGIERDGGFRRSVFIELIGGKGVSFAIQLRG